ncbi:MAG: hypothetical protein JXX14_17395 [Deltaproteobacteria bacterium]|nr:hypothetical protein [Deltaproteobacteria bacterium]
MSEWRFQFRVPAGVFKICETFRDNNEVAYLVGGSLRDLLLGVVPDDWDLATTATPDKTMTLFRRVIPTGIDHGTVTVLLGGGAYEITTLRAENGYTDGRHPDSVEFVSNIVEDLSRRDFTINAIAWNPLTQEGFDPFDGRSDLLAKRIVAVGDARARFEEDGLRIMRAARFAATLQFQIEPSTKAAIADTAHRLENVSIERRRDEFQKLLLASKPSIGLQVLAENHLFRHVCPGHRDWGNVGYREQIFDLVDAVPPSLHLRMTALWLGLSIESAEQWLADFLIDRSTRKKVMQLLPHFPFQYTPDWTDHRLRRHLSAVGRANIPDFLTILEAQAKTGIVVRDLAASFVDRLQALDWENVPLCIGDLAVSGADLMTGLQLGPGPKVGDLLRVLLSHVLDCPNDNHRERLLDVARKHLSVI